MLITVNGCLGSSPVNEKIRHQISRTDRPKIGVDSNSPITGFQAGDFEKLERKTPPTFSQSCSEKGGEGGDAGVDGDDFFPAGTPLSPASPPFSEHDWEMPAAFLFPIFSNRRLEIR